MARKVQRVFGTSEVSPSQILKNIFRLLDGRSKENTKLWVGKVLSFFQVQGKGWEEEGNFAFVLCMDISPPCDNVHQVLRLVRLWRSTDNDIDYSLKKRGRCSGNQPLSAVECFGVEPFRSIRSTIHVVTENFAVDPYTEELRWPLRRFYI